MQFELTQKRKDDFEQFLMLIVVVSVVEFSFRMGNLFLFEQFGFSMTVNAKMYCAGGEALLHGIGGLIIGDWLRKNAREDDRPIFLWFLAGAILGWWAVMLYYLSAILSLLKMDRETPAPAAAVTPR